jgi:hypothetical protein
VEFVAEDFDGFEFFVGHLLAPGGKWCTVMATPSSSAGFWSSIFHNRMREPLLPPPSAVIVSDVARG